MTQNIPLKTLDVDSRKNMPGKVELIHHGKFDQDEIILSWIDTIIVQFIQSR